MFATFGARQPLFETSDLHDFARVSYTGGHLKPVTLKPVSRIFRIFRIFVSAFSAFSAFLFRGISSNPCFSRVRGTFRIFRIFPVSGSNR